MVPDRKADLYDHVVGNWFRGARLCGDDWHGLVICLFFASSLLKFGKGRGVFCVLGLLGPRSTASRAANSHTGPPTMIF
jgi:hypothetical protein